MYEMIRCDHLGRRNDHVEYTKFVIRSISSELDMSDEHDLERITRICCDTFAVVRNTAPTPGSFNANNARNLQERWSEIPPTLAAALDLRERVCAHDQSFLSQSQRQTLAAAAYQGNADMVSMIIDQIGETHVTDQAFATAMRMAIERNHENTIRRLATRKRFPIFHALPYTIRRRNTRMFHVLVDVLGGWDFFKNKLSCLPMLMREAVQNEAFDVLRALLKCEHITQQLHDQCIERGYCCDCNAIGTGLRAAAQIDSKEALQIILEHGHHPDVIVTGKRATQDLLNDRTPMRSGFIPKWTMPSGLARQVETLRLLHEYGADMTLDLSTRLRRAINDHKHDYLRFYASIRDEGFAAQAFDEAVELALDMGPFWLLCAWILLPEDKNSELSNTHKLWPAASPKMWDRALASSPIAEIHKREDSPDQEGISSLRWWRDIRNYVYCALRFRQFVCDWDREIPVNDEDDMNSKTRRALQKAQRQALRSDQILLEQPKAQVQPYGSWSVL